MGPVPSGGEPGIPCGRRLSGFPIIGRCVLSSKPAVSKAGPISKDLKAIVVINAVAVISMVLFAVLGLSVAYAANGSFAF